MIKIIEEPAQVHAGITNGCDACGSREKEKIKTIYVKSGYGGQGMMINMCEDCRKLLKEKL